MKGNKGNRGIPRTGTKWLGAGQKATLFWLEMRGEWIDSDPVGNPYRKSTARILDSLAARGLVHFESRPGGATLYRTLGRIEA